jgi:signal transduction histidine kinase
MAAGRSIESRAELKRRQVVLLRWVLILASAALIIFNSKTSDLEQIHKIVALLLCSNFLLTLLPAKLFVRRHFDPLLVCADIAIVSLCLYLTGHVNSDFFLLYFLVIMTAALSETPRALIWSAVVVCAVYLAMIERLEGVERIFSTDVLIRIPFFLIVSLFYGHLTQQARQETARRNRLQSRLNMAAQVRKLSRMFSGALSRREVLKGLVRAERRLCGVPRAAIFSRGAKSILSSAGESRISEPDFEKLLLGIQQTVKEFECDSPLQEISRRLIRKGATIRGAGFTLIPLTGRIDSDLYLALEGNISDELVDHVKLLLMNAVLALKNAGQYQALLHEVEKRRHVSEDLVSALESKSAFVANVSHELRTPVNAILGFSELLLDGAYGQLPEETLTTVKRIQENAIVLQELINDILDFSKLEAGKFEKRLSLGSLPRFLEDLLETTTALVRDKPLVVRGEADPVELKLDWGILRQIALNLTSNAVKFTPRGEITIRLALESDSLSLTVVDTGIGIKADKIKEIFEPFTQVENTYTKRFAGTGLGLSITRRQVELLGGTISVESEPGKGSKFMVVIPVSLSDRISVGASKDSRLNPQVSPA